MRCLHRTALVGLALAVCAAPGAVAHQRHEGGVVVPPPPKLAGLTGGELLGEAWVQFLSHPAGTFTGGCMPVARKVVAPEPQTDGTATCTVRKGTSLMFFLGSECSNVEPPPFYGADEAAQRACALAADERFAQAATLAIDRREPVEALRPRFERISPQRTVQLPPDNVLGVAPQTATFVAHGWVALVRTLRPGRHTIRGTVTNLENVTMRFRFRINVRRQRAP